MSYDATVFQIMIASPSDVQDERRIAIEVIYHWNATHSANSHIVLLPLLWEMNATPELGDRPQAIINKQLVSQADILIGVFWTRLGTPTGTSESGTAEEIHEIEDAGKQVILYFSEREADVSRVDPTELTRLRAFKGDLYQRGLVGSFSSVEDFRTKLTADLTKAVTKLAGRSPLDNSDKLASVKRTDEPNVQPAAKFLERFEPSVRYFESRWVVERDSEPHNTTDGRSIIEVARKNLEQIRSHEFLTNHPDIQAKLTAILTDMAKIKNRRLYMDGGVSFQAFWDEGDRILNELNTLVASLKQVSTSA